MGKAAEQHSGNLKVAVCLDSLFAPAWIHEMLLEIKTIPCVEIVLVLLPSPEADKASSRKRHKWTSVVPNLLRKPGQLAYQIWDCCDRAIIKFTPDAFRKLDCTELSPPVKNFTTRVAAMRGVFAPPRRSWIRFVAAGPMSSCDSLPLACRKQL